MIEPCTPTLALAALLSLGLPASPAGDPASPRTEEPRSTCDAGPCVSTLLEKVVRGEALDPSLEGEAAACASNCPVNALAARLRAEPAAWDAIAPGLSASFTREDACPETRSRLLSVLLLAPGPRSLAVAEQLLARVPDALGDQAATAFAERGSKAFAGELWRRVESGNDRSVYPAAFLVAHGEPTCEVSLAHVQAFWDGAGPDSDLAQVLAAAFALRRAGCEEAVPSVQRELHAMTLAALDGGELERARDLALRADFVAHVVARPLPAVGLAGLDWAMQEHLTQGSRELALCGDAVFERIEAVTPLLD